ncbi:MAG: hypothetical protein ACOCQN_01350 [Halanaerobiaceae bacterium]
MNLRSFAAVFIATLAYTISTVYGLIRGIPLFAILKTGISILLISGIGTWLVIALIENMADRAEDNNDENPEEDNEESNTDNTTGNGNKSKNNDRSNDLNPAANGGESEGFSPMTPPVLEVARQKVNGGEDNT